MIIFPMRFGERFSAQRKKKHLSVEQAAKACGISRSYIVLIESDKRRPSVKVMPKIAEVMKLPVNVILNWYLEDMREKLNYRLGTKTK